MFPKRFETAICPEYPDLRFKLLANPSGAVYEALLEGSTATEKDAAALGAAMVEVYAGTTVEGYGVVLDFSTVEGVLVVLKNTALPADLRFWIRHAPIEIVQYGRDEIEKNFQKSLINGS